MNVLSETFRINADAIAQEVGGELIVLDMATERYLSVDQVGRRIWGLLEEGRTLSNVVDELTSLYSVDRARIEHDVAEFVQRLEELGLGRTSSK